MDLAQAQKKIEEQYRQTLANNQELAAQVACTAKSLGNNPSIFLDGFLKYDTNVGTYGNKIYEDVSVKAGMFFKYFVEESYQSERQAILADMVRSCEGIKNLVDVGFAVPGKYVLETLKERPDVHMTLLDKFQSSITFSEAFLSCVNSVWKNQITLGTYDMDLNVSPGQFDLYIFFDSIEHTKNPGVFLNTVLSSAPKDATFIFSLPIERIEVSGGEEGDQMHFIEFTSEDAIRGWLKKHNLEILEEKTTKPKAGDVWLPIEDTFYNLIVKAKLENFVAK